MDCCLIRLILIVVFVVESVISEVKEEACTLLIKYPAWLADKHAAYVRWNNESFRDNALHQQRLKKLYESNYNEHQDTDYSGNDDSAFWAEKFSKEEEVRDSQYFKDLYKRRAQAMFNRKPVREVYNDDPDNTYITDLDKQLINQTIAFPDDYGIPTTCKYDSADRRLKIWRWRTPIPIALNFTDEDKKLMIKKVMGMIQFMTCVSFVPIDSENMPQHFVLLDGNANSCYSYRGALRQRVYQQNPKIWYQDLKLPDGCFIPGTITHEFFHLLGITHEHQRFDRDLYLNHGANQTDQMKKSLRKFFTPDTPKTPYRYDSCMHYPTTSLKITRTITNGSITFDQARTICTLSDFNRINYMYACTADTTHDTFDDLINTEFPVPPFPAPAA